MSRFFQFVIVMILLAVVLLFPAMVQACNYGGAGVGTTFSFTQPMYAQPFVQSYGVQAFAAPYVPQLNFGVGYGGLGFNLGYGQGFVQRQQFNHHHGQQFRRDRFRGSRLRGW